MTNPNAPHIWLPEPKLAFHPDRTSDQDIHPLRGLLRFGPHSSGLVPAPIRVATIAPAGESGRLYSFLKELNSVSLSARIWSSRARGRYWLPCRT